MADDKEAAAVDTVARHILNQCWAAALLPGTPPVTKDYPHLSTEQGEKVRSRCSQIVDALVPSEEEFLAAYEYLTGELP
jgi:hypothetical protein